MVPDSPSSARVAAQGRLRFQTPPTIANSTNRTIPYPKKHVQTIEIQSPRATTASGQWVVDVVVAADPTSACGAALVVVSFIVRGPGRNRHTIPGGRDERDK